MAEVRDEMRWEHTSHIKAASLSAFGGKVDPGDVNPRKSKQAQARSEEEQKAKNRQVIRDLTQYAKKKE